MYYSGDTADSTSLAALAESRHHVSSIYGRARGRGGDIGPWCTKSDRIGAVGPPDFGAFERIMLSVARKLTVYRRACTVRVIYEWIQARYHEFSCLYPE